MKIIRVGSCNHCGACCHPDCTFFKRDALGKVICPVFFDDVNGVHKETGDVVCTREVRINYPSYTDRLLRTCSFRFMEIEPQEGQVIREVTKYRKARRNFRGTTTLDPQDLEWES